MQHYHIQFPLIFPELFSFYFFMQHLLLYGVDASAAGPILFAGVDSEWVMRHCIIRH